MAIAGVEVVPDTIPVEGATATFVRHVVGSLDDLDWRV